MYRRFLKRAIDILLSTVLLIVLFPVFVIMSILLFIENRGSPFFRQVRVGHNERLFQIVKFRTMNEKRNSLGELLSDEKRLNRFGKFVRNTSLDEIPQLINVLKGDMSLIGPRPLLLEYLPFYSVQQRRRHDVRPGITGWAQVNGRNSINWFEKFQYDVFYVDQLSFSLDLKIVVKTIWKVLKSEGISGKGVATAEKFTGAN